MSVQTLDVPALLADAAKGAKAPEAKASPKAPADAAKAPAKTPRKRTAKAPANPVLTPAEAEAARVQAEADAKAKRLTELRAAFTEAKAGETKAGELLKLAKLTRLNSRVVTSRIVFAVGMLEPYNGECNLAYATRELVLTDAQRALPANEVKALVKNKKTSIAKYRAAGMALDAAGLANNVTEPTAPEREITATAFGDKYDEDGNPIAKADAPAPAGTGEDADADANAKGEDGDALNAAAFMRHISGLNRTLTAVKAGNVLVSEDEAAEIMAMLDAFKGQLTEYVNADA